MSVGPRFALPALLALLALLAGATGAATAQPATAPPVENTTLSVQLQPNGDARWSVSATYTLTTDNETAAFRTLAEEFEQGEGSLGLPAFREAAEAAAETTGRSMEITDVERTSSPDRVIENGTGRLTLSFTWTRFASVDDNRVRVGDVFETDEAWLTGLGPDQELVIVSPPGYGLFDASPEVPAPQNGTIRWEGPVSFGEDGFSVSFTGDPAGNGDSSSPPPGVGDDTGAAVFWVGVVVLGAAVAATAYAVARRREPGETIEPGDSTGTSAEANPDGGAVGTERETGTEPDSEPDDGVDEELLSDEERVERLLERNDGRMKQANIVKETGWSNAKVSQLLSAMDEEGRIDKLRIGRENLISFPDEDVTDTDDS